MNQLNYEAALRLAGARISGFPCELKAKRPCYGVRFTIASARTEAGVTYYWRKFPDARPAINLGGAGLVVVDLDRNHKNEADGVAEFERLLDQFGELPAGCPMVRTPSGGVHIYFRQPAGAEPIGNSVGKEGRALGPGIDVRGYHGFVLAPGAVTADGEFYEGIAGTPDLAEAFAAKAIPVIPDWLAKLAEKHLRVIETIRGPSVARAFVDCDRRPYGIAILNSEAAELAGVQSYRNQALNDSTFAVSTKAGAHGLVTEAETWDAMWNSCVINGWLAKDGAKAFQSTFYSAWNAGLADPTPLRERFTRDNPAFAERIRALTHGAQSK